MTIPKKNYLIDAINEALGPLQVAIANAAEVGLHPELVVSTYCTVTNVNRVRLTDPFHIEVQSKHDRVIRGILPLSW